MKAAECMRMFAILCTSNNEMIHGQVDEEISCRLAHPFFLSSILEELRIPTACLYKGGRVGGIYVFQYTSILHEPSYPS